MKCCETCIHYQKDCDRYEQNKELCFICIKPGRYRKDFKVTLCDNCYLDYLLMEELMKK